MAPKTTLPVLLTTEEVADQFRVTTRTVRRWVQDGKIPTVRLGTGGSSRVLFREGDIAAFIAASLFVAPERE